MQRLNPFVDQFTAQFCAKRDGQRVTALIALGLGMTSLTAGRVVPQRLAKRLTPCQFSMGEIPGVIGLSRKRKKSSASKIGSRLRLRLRQFLFHPVDVLRGICGLWVGLGIGANKAKRIQSASALTNSTVFDILMRERQRFRRGIAAQGNQACHTRIRITAGNVQGFVPCRIHACQMGRHITPCVFLQNARGLLGQGTWCAPRHMSRT